MTSKEQALGVGVVGICIGAIAFIFALGGMAGPSTFYEQVFINTSENTAQLMLNSTNANYIRGIGFYDQYGIYRTYLYYMPSQHVMYLGSLYPTVLLSDLNFNKHLANYFVLGSSSIVGTAGGLWFDATQKELKFTYGTMPWENYYVLDQNDIGTWKTSRFPTSAPGSPVTGDSWFNATSDILWIYNGSAWNPH